MTRLPLLGRFAVTAFVVVSVVGGLFAANTQREIRARELRAADDAAELLVGFGIRPLLEPADFEGAPDAAASARTRRAVQGVLVGRTEIVTLVDGRGDVVLSTGPVDDVIPPVVLDVDAPRRPRRATSSLPDGSTWLHVRVPILFGDGQVVGDAIVTSPLAPVLSAIRQQVAREVTILTAGLLLLFALLYRSFATASTALRRHAEERDHAATHDDLTGLANRTLLSRAMQEAVSRRDAPDQRAALLLLDLDRFKEVNDTLGHPAGDRLLCGVADRLRRAIHDTDTLTRLGGDEFAVLLPTIPDPATAVAVAERLVRCLDEPFDLGDIEVSVGASVGISVSPDDAADATDMLKHADSAMYAAKRTGDEVRLYSPEEDDTDVDRLTLLAELRRAIEQDQLLLHYQPQLELETGRIAAVEALVRWQHPTRGLLGPGAFIDIAEQSGLMGPLTTWVLEAALAQLGEWDRLGIPMAVAVNVSPHTLAEQGLASRILTSLARWDIAPNRLELEITEHELVEEREAVTETLHVLRSLEVRISIDDFGTGYSSLSYLTELPVDVLKIDRSLVASFEEREAQATVLRTICQLGHALGLSVVAEGVEDDRALPALHRLGVDLVQGYALWRPAPAHEITALLSGRAHDPPSDPPCLAARPATSPPAADTAVEADTAAAPDEADVPVTTAGPR